MLDHEKSKNELIGELVALRQRVKDLEKGMECSGSIEYARSKEQADFYLTILDEAPALIWRADTSAKCDWFNATWLAFTGRELMSEIGDGWAEGVHPDDFDRCLETYLGAFHARQYFEMEYRLRRFDGEYRWILDIGCPFRGVDGQFAGYIGYCFDVTERKRNEEFRAEIEHVISHDIKTPLTGLHGLAQVVFEDGLDEDYRQLIPGLLRALRRVIILVDSKGKFEAIKQGRYAPQSEWLSFEAMVKDVVVSLGETTGDGGRVILSENVRTGRCYGEDVLVYDMISNIIKNALEASPPGGKVTVDCLSNDGRFLFLVHNTGSIPARIRESFAQQYVTAGKPGGTGLGAYSAKLIAEAHGGHLRFTTSEGEGTTVTIDLPCPETTPPFG